MIFYMKKQHFNMIFHMNKWISRSYNLYSISYIDIFYNYNLIKKILQYKTGFKVYSATK